MNLTTPAVVTVCLLLVSCGEAAKDTTPAPAASEASAGTQADLVILGVTVHTMDGTRSRASAIAIRAGTIAAIGDREQMRGVTGPGTRILELDGAMVLPGFHDAHVHPVSGGIELLQCALSGLPTVAAVTQRVVECAAGSEGWVQGGGWELSLFPQGNAPKLLLDEILPERPVFLTGADGHSAWVNTRALQLAGIDSNTEAPPLGVIERDPVSGEPSGTLRESAMSLVARLLPEVSAEQRLEGLRVGLRLANEAGITSFIDASVGERELAAYASLYDRGELSARVLASLEYGTTFMASPASFADLFARRASFVRSRLATDSIKIFLDGVLEGETAALLEPYLGPRGHRGTLNFERAALDEAVVRFDREGIQVHMHAIGDRATRAGLDAVAAARAANGPGRPHHIAHLQLIAPEDLPRFAQLNVYANFQALWAYPDHYIVDLNTPSVGAERVQRMYPVASVLRAGGTVVGGSDWSVSSIRPLEAIRTALERTDAEGVLPGILNANERVSLDDMLAAYTINSARLMGHEDSTGSIEKGKRADLVILDRDISAGSPGEIADARVLATLVDGEFVYQAGPIP